MKTSQIRQKFIDFFVANQHQLIPSSRLLPKNDPTLLFTNAGMNQFKDVFLGLREPPALRVVTVQKCMRAGGKHNDLENVGYTARHHTFFEMLGNFSFGDYFKPEAIHFAWDFLTSEKWLNLPAERLLVTVYESDEASYQIWHDEIQLPNNKIIKIGDKAPGVSDNFWQMGDTGPCGPCTEIFYDHGNQVAGGPPGSSAENGDRFTEIWNCVFMQFNRDSAGQLKKLPRPSVDTGMGLERIAAVMQGVFDNYETDAFKALVANIQDITQSTLKEGSSLKVIADHIRAISFLIADGVFPSNEGQGYVLRRIIRRASRHGYQLGQKKSFLYKLVRPLAFMMESAYPELTQKTVAIENVILEEENRFAKTCERGMLLLEENLQKSAKILSGDIVFLLYDTFGFPVDLTADICKERGFSIDQEGFEKAMQKQRQQSQQHTTFKQAQIVPFEGPPTSFEGYQKNSLTAKIIALYQDHQSVDQLRAGESGIILLDQTPFYAESGGQVGDSGKIVGKNNLGVFEVLDTQKIKEGVFGHYGVAQAGLLKLNDNIEATIDLEKRKCIANNHSAAHLLHTALRQIMGEESCQKGSLITAETIRFDFAQSKPLTREELVAIENFVNDIIAQNKLILATDMTREEALKNNAIALFDEKYGKKVRVLTIGEVSCELCGGTHASSTGQIGLFKIIKEQSVAAGIRRIEAITGQAALSYTQKQQHLLAEIALLLNTKADKSLPAQVNAFQAKLKVAEKRLSSSQEKLAKNTALLLANQAQEIDGIASVIATLSEENSETLKQTVDALKKTLKKAVIVLASPQENGTVLLATGITDNLTHQLHAGELMSYLTQLLGGKGGGKADGAQGSGKLTENLSMVLQKTNTWIHEKNSV